VSMPTAQSKMNIYVGNLSVGVTAEELRPAFEAFGQVIAVTIFRDKTGGQPRGYGYVEMPNEAEAHAAISSLNGKELKWRPIIVNKSLVQ